jgi:hypothetical protein
MPPADPVYAVCKSHNLRRAEANHRRAAAAEARCRDLERYFRQAKVLLALAIAWIIGLAVLLLSGCATTGSGAQQGPAILSPQAPQTATASQVADIAARVETIQQSQSVVQNDASLLRSALRYQTVGSVAGLGAVLATVWWFRYRAEKRRYARANSVPSVRPLGPPPPMPLPPKRTS